MKIVRTYPNLLWLILNFVFLIFFGILIFIFISILFNFKIYFIINDPNRFWTIFPLIFTTFIFVYFYCQLSNGTIWFSLNDHHRSLLFYNNFFMGLYYFPISFFKILNSIFLLVQTPIGRGRIRGHYFGW